MVLGYHFMAFDREGIYLFPENMRSWAAFGAQGVELFFLISGFVMWYSMKQAGFTFAQTGRYLKKRIIRIIPAYWMTIALILVLQLIWNGNIPYEGQTIFKNALFLIDSDGLSSWINPVFSTLRVEMIFYLVLIPMAPMLLKFRFTFFPIVLFVLGLRIVVPTLEFVHYLPYFLLGMLLLEWKQDRSMLPFLSILILWIYIYFFYALEDFVIVSLGIPALLIPYRTRSWMRALGKASYALYLTHGLIGGTLLYVLMKWSFFVEHAWLTFAIATFSSIVFAQLFHRYFEKPVGSWLTQRFIKD